jgi:hypothetical protein
MKRARSPFPSDAAVWPMWRDLKRHFPVWSLLPSAFWTPGAFGYFGADHVSGFRSNASTRAVFALMEARTDGELESLAALTDLNARRQRQMFTAVAVSYVTLPLTLIATWAEIAPDAIQLVIRDHPNPAIQGFIGLTLVALYYFCSHWRARQMVEVLDLVRIERGIQTKVASAPAGKAARTKATKGATPPS